MEGLLAYCFALTWVYFLLFFVFLFLMKYRILNGIDEFQLEFEELFLDAAVKKKKQRSFEDFQAGCIQIRKDQIIRKNLQMETAQVECSSWIKDADFQQTHHCEMPVMDKQFLDHIEYHLNMNDSFPQKSKFMPHFKTNINFLVCFAWNFAEDHQRKLDSRAIWKKDRYVDIDREETDFTFNFPVGFTSAPNAVPTDTVRFVAEKWEGKWRLVTMYPIASSPSLF